MRVTVERLGRRERREQPDQTFGQHRLARPGRPDHEEVVPPRRGDLDGAAAEGLAPHVGEVGRCRDAHCSAGRWGGGPGGLTAQDGDQISQRGRAVHSRTADELGLPHVAERHDQSEGGGRIGQSDHARDVAQRPVQPQLATESETLGAIRVQLAGGDEQTHRDREGRVPRRLCAPPKVRGSTVILRMGQGRPLDRMAARTRSRASRTAASGRPTMVKPGSPLETWTSTETPRPTAPLKMAEATEASMRRNGRTRGPSEAQRLAVSVRPPVSPRRSPLSQVETTGGAPVGTTMTGRWVWAIYATSPA